MRWDQLEPGQQVFFWRTSTEATTTEADPVTDYVDMVYRKHGGVQVALRYWGTVNADTLFATSSEAYASRAKEVAKVCATRLEIAKALHAKALSLAAIPAELIESVPLAKAA